MKKNNTSMTKITVFLIFLIVLVVGYYSYLSGKSRTEQQEAIMSEVDTALSRDLTNNYPATPKEVIKYYNDLIKCFYNEDCTTEELQELGRKSLQLFDARIACGYGMTENGKKSSTMLVYLLRRDENRKWRIYGWETADQLNDSLEQQENN